jgi:ABC-type multidrug transport system fused ATPase/permease subunit
MLFFGMILEAVSLTLLLPVISVIVSDENPFKYLDWDFFNSLSSSLSKSELMYLCFGILFIIYLIKTLFLLMLTYFQNLFVSNLSASISNSLFERYLSENYSFHLNNNSSKMVKNFQVEVINFIAYLRGLLNSFIETFLLLAIIITLVYFEPYPAIIIGFSFGLLSFLFLNFTKPSISRYSKEREQLDSSISKLAIESLSGIKDLKINNAGIYFLNKFENTQNSRASIATKYNTINQVPRYFFELTAVVGIIILIIFKIVFLKEFENLITSIGIFVAATFRMMPSINRIVSGFQSINYYQNSLGILHNSLNSSGIKESLNSPKKLSFKEKINFDKTSFFYENQDKKIFESVTLEFSKNTIIGLIGPSGSGKSTFVDLLTGLLKPTTGSIKVDNTDIRQDKSLEWRNSIGYVSQKIFLIDDTISKNIAFGMSAGTINKSTLKDSIERSELSQLISKLENGYNSTVGEGGAKLSGGQLQRIGIARALYRKPDLLILDESTASLDKQTEKSIFKSLVKLKNDMTILIISHDLNNLSICDEIYKIEDKKILKQNYK